MPTLDLRELPPPLPMQRILQALEEAPVGTELRALTPLWPTPLLALLSDRGLAYCAEPQADGGALIVIRC
jgi:uncharacterized protein (DUF2249 family)